MGETDLQFWVVVWLAAATFVVVRHWHAGGVGILFAYVLSYAALHWLSPAFALLPWHFVRDLDITAVGLRYATYGMLAFAAGAEIASAWYRSRHAASPDDAVSLGKAVAEGVVNTYIVAGAVMYFVATRFGAGLPTVNALVTTGAQLIVVGFALKCWNHWHKRHQPLMWAWLASCGMFPLVTVMAQGFLGYGFSCAAIVLAFFAGFYRPRWRVAVVAVLVSYFGFSGYVTYMRDRSDIRAIVWTGGTINDRMERVSETLTSPEWFDPQNPDHLNRIDTRLNQNYFIGAAAARLESGLVTFAHGETLVAAAAAMIPRVLWPDKPVVAGSGDLVSIYTGINFDRNTAVGVGQLLESYINFGGIGVIVIFLLIGAAVSMADRFAHAHLASGNVEGFTRWFLPGLSVLNLGGSFAELTSTAGAALIVALLVNRAIASGRRDVVSWVPDAPDESRTVS